MTKAELKNALKLNDAEQIILSCYIDLEIDGNWEENFETVTDMKTFKSLINDLKSGKCISMYMCNSGHDVEYNEFVNNCSIQVITQAEANVLKKYNAFTTLHIDDVY